MFGNDRENNLFGMEDNLDSVSKIYEEYVEKSKALSELENILDDSNDERNDDSNENTGESITDKIFENGNDDNMLEGKKEQQDNKEEKEEKNDEELTNKNKNEESESDNEDNEADDKSLETFNEMSKTLNEALDKKDEEDNKEIKKEDKDNKDSKEDKENTKQIKLDKPNSNKTNLVTFKGSRRGIEIFLSDDEEVTFEEVFENLLMRIEATKEVFKDVRCGIVLKGRKLTSKEEDLIVVALRKNMNISIDYINNNNFYSEDVIRIDKNDSRKDYAETMYYHGTLRSGQSLHNNASIVIFGDVNPGSEVIAGGNLIVMGSLRGIVQAGQRSNDAYIVAFDMNPKQLRIGDHIARAADEGEDERIKKPHKAYLEDGQICIEPIEGTFNLIEKDC